MFQGFLDCLQCQPPPTDKTKANWGFNIPRLSLKISHSAVLISWFLLDAWMQGSDSSNSASTPPIKTINYPPCISWFLGEDFNSRVQSSRLEFSMIPNQIKYLYCYLHFVLQKSEATAPKPGEQTHKWGSRGATVAQWLLAGCWRVKN